ncbi:hypothetical protein AgCh_030560 [Apium graveolens]
MKITADGDCENSNHRHGHGRVKKRKHGHKHKHAKRELVDLTLRLGLPGQQDVDKSTAKPVAVINEKIKNFAVYTPEEEEEEKSHGVSTKLTLSTHPL